MQAKSVLPHHWAVPQIFRDRLGDQAGRQRAMGADGHLLLILHELPETGERARRGRFFWRQPDGTWTSHELGGGTRALDKHLTEYADLVDKLEAQVGRAQSAQDYFTVMRALGPLHRAASNMHSTLQHAREMYEKYRDIIVFRDRAVEIERAAALVYEDAKNGMDFAIARETEEQSQSSQRMAISAHRLNVLAAFFFPLATLGAIFGMNLKIGLEEEVFPIPFLIVLVFGLIAGLVIKSFIGQGLKKSDGAAD